MSMSLSYCPECKSLDVELTEESGGRNFRVICKNCGFKYPNASHFEIVAANLWNGYPRDENT
jgi:translation initiation factor 2 beta subunit (eIF-2beta)/eIF-5